jgi:branched-chain amino acid transport system permease protein
MTTLIQQLINSLTIGSEYALIALGYTMVYGVLRLINFAHGEVFMVGAYAGAYMAQALNRAAGRPEAAAQPFWQFMVVVLTAVLVSGLLGYLIERLAYRPLRRSSRLSALITAIGVSLLLQNLAQIEWKVGGRSYFGPTEVTFPALAGVNDKIAWIYERTGLAVIPRDMIELAMCLSLLAVLWFVVKKTRMGKAMRAVSVNYDASRLMGININRVISFTFILGSVLAGLGACFYGVRTNKCTFNMGLMLGLKAFIAAVIGGIGNLPGAVMGAFLLGFLETLVSTFQIGGVGLSLYKNAIAFVILIVVLLVRPEGLLGRAVPEKV